MIKTPKGELIPQTVENLQEIMARDAEEMLRLRAEISRLNADNNRLRQKLLKARSHNHG